MNNNNSSMIDVNLDETEQVDGGFNWCAAFFIGGSAAFAAGLTGGAGTFAGAEIGAMGAALFCD